MPSSPQRNLSGGKNPTTGPGRNSVRNGKYNIMQDENLEEDDDTSDPLAHLDSFTSAKSTLRKNAAVRKTYRLLNGSSKIDFTGCNNYLRRLLKMNERKIKDEAEDVMSHPSFISNHVSVLRRLFLIQEQMSFEGIPSQLKLLFRKYKQAARRTLPKGRKTTLVCPGLALYLIRCLDQSGKLFFDQAFSTAVLVLGGRRLSEHEGLTMKDIVSVTPLGLDRSKQIVEVKIRLMGSKPKPNDREVIRIIGSLITHPSELYPGFNQLDHVNLLHQLLLHKFNVPLYNFEKNVSFVKMMNKKANLWVKERRIVDFNLTNFWKKIREVQTRIEFPEPVSLRPHGMRSYSILKSYQVSRAENIPAIALLGEGNATHTYNSRVSSRHYNDDSFRSLGSLSPVLMENQAVRECDIWKDAPSLEERFGLEAPLKIKYTKDFDKNYFRFARRIYFDKVELKERTKAGELSWDLAVKKKVTGTPKYKSLVAKLKERNGVTSIPLEALKELRKNLMVRDLRELERAKIVEYVSAMLG